MVDASVVASIILRKLKGLVQDTSNVLDRAMEISWTSDKGKEILHHIIGKWNSINVDNGIDPEQIIRDCKTVLVALAVALKIDYQENKEDCTKAKALVALIEVTETTDPELKHHQEVSTAAALAFEDDAEKDERLLREVDAILKKY